MPTTSRGFPYPTSGDDVDVPGDLQALATAIDANLTTSLAAIEGTAIKATGVTANYVLSANGSNGAAWTTIPGAGGLTSGTITATLAFGGYQQANIRFINQGTVNARGLTTTNGGTVTVSLTTTGTNHYVRSHNALLGTVSGTAGTAGALTIAAVVAGTISADQLWVGGKGFGSGTGIVFTQLDLASTTGNATYSLRKYNTTLASNAWNATIISNVATPGATWQWYPGQGEYFRGWEWVPQHDVWITGESKNAQVGNVTTFYAVNDTSGSVYTAPFGTCTATQYWWIDQFAFVPNATSGSGTVYVLGQGRDTASGTVFTGRLVKYALGSAGISAIGTTDLSYGSLRADNELVPYPTLASSGDIGVNPAGMYWDSASTAIIVFNHINNPSVTQLGATRSTFIAYDRTFTSELWRSGQVYFGNASFNSVEKQAGFYDPSAGWLALNTKQTTGNSYFLGKIGGPGYGYAHRVATINNTRVTLAGTGTASTMAYVPTSTNDAQGGTYTNLQAQYNLSVGTVFASSGIGRMITYDHVSSYNDKLVGFYGGTGMVPLFSPSFMHYNTTVYSGGTMTNTNALSFPVYLPAGQAFVAITGFDDNLNPLNLSGTGTASARSVFRAINLS